MLKRTPLYATHKKLNARMVDFGGWEMPVQYVGVIEEHQTVRNAAGLFDVSHMGEIEVTGEKAEDFLQNLITNDIKKLSPGKIIYTTICYENGGIVDDLLVHMLEENHYMLCVNASNIEKDFEWMLKNRVKGTEIINTSAETAQLAVQGPVSEKILQQITDTDLCTLKYYHFIKGKVNGADALIARTGYTGEDGFEIYCGPDVAVSLFEILLERGKKSGIMPIGLAARDTLRLEMGYSLYGHEINEKHNPLEANLGWVVNFNDENFIGKDALLELKSQRLKRKLVGFEVTERGIPRAGYEIFVGGKKTGEVASGTFSPTLKKAIGTGYVESEFAAISGEININIRGKMVKSKIVKPPFYKRKK